MKRPAEITALPLICFLSFDFLTERGVPDTPAAFTALAIGVLPWAVSIVKDRRDK